MNEAFGWFLNAAQQILVYCFVGFLNGRLTRWRKQEILGSSYGTQIREPDRKKLWDHYMPNTRHSMEGLYP